MSDGVQFKATLDVTAQSEQVVTEFAIAHLKQRGYDVAAPNEKWETLRAFLRRIGVRYDAFYKSLNHRARPNVLVRRHRGGAGRIAEICSNAAFDAFCRRHKR
jgi:hypothetical protein